MMLQRLNEMVECERCHRKFVSYAALSQHFDTKHRSANKPPELEGKLAAERELDRYNATVHYARGPSKTKLAAFLLILIVAAGVIGYVAFTPREQTGGSILGSGSVAPDFILPDVEGGTFTLSAYRGKANVLLFFNEGLSCAPCLKQMSDLDQLNQQFTKLDIIVVSITGDSVSLLSSWAHSSGPQYGKVLSDQNLAVSKIYDMLGPDKSMMPGTAPGHSFVLVDKSGMIEWRQDYGPSVMYVPNDQVIAAVRRALGA
jgi:peroxiredoxin